jgi:hypothetical protein
VKKIPDGRSRSGMAMNPSPDDRDDDEDNIEVLLIWILFANGCVGGGRGGGDCRFNSNKSSC